MRYSAFAIALVFTAVATSGCTYFRRQDADQTESLLAAAGFDIKVVDTPKRQESIARFPVRKLVSRVKDDDIVYVYADPDFCKCMYIGDKHNYARYQRMAFEQNIADEQVEAAQMNEDAWMGMGVWGPYWGPY